MMAGHVVAEDKESTVEFFISLFNCTPGNYKERNILSSSYGPMWLDHEIYGMDEEFCSVRLASADGRSLQCMFPLHSLNFIGEQHFITGISNNTLNSPSQQSLRADKAWSDVKQDYCALGGY